MANIWWLNIKIGYKKYAQNTSNMPNNELLTSSVYKSVCNLNITLFSPRNHRLCVRLTVF